jgi:hypothetical protein
MTTFNHVSNTWLVAVFFFPILFLGYDLLATGNTTPELLPALFLFGTFFSLPSYFLCLLFFKTVMQSAFTMQARLLLWMVVYPALHLCRHVAHRAAFFPSYPSCRNAGISSSGGPCCVAFCSDTAAPIFYLHANFFKTP